MTELLKIVLIVLIVFVVLYGVGFYIKISLDLFKHVNKISVIVIILFISIISGAGLAGLNMLQNQPGARNAQRSSDVLIILDAVWAYARDEGYQGKNLSAIPVCQANSGEVLIGEIGTGKVNLAGFLSQNYLSQLPLDPLVGTQDSTGYTICRNQEERFVVAAPKAESGKLIVVKR